MGGKGSGNKNLSGGPGRTKGCKNKKIKDLNDALLKVINERGGLDFIRRLSDVELMQAAKDFLIEKEI
jgi:hypothetical protein